MRFHKPVPHHHQPHLSLNLDTSRVDRLEMHQGGIPADGHYDPKSIAVAGAGFDDGGPLSGSINPFKNLLDRTGRRMGNPSAPAQRAEDYQTYGPSQQQAGPSHDDQNTGSDASNKDTYDSGGVVDPHAYVRWPGGLPQAGFDDGGEVGSDDGGVSDPATADLVAHSRQVYDGIHARMRAAFEGQGKNQNGQFNQPAQAQQTNQPGYAQGGGIPAPGPAGAGVTPKPAKSHEAAVERNYYQDVSSRPATSPARGTAYGQPAPDGGQRGQEWYGKGPSPYGAGRKKQNG